jgi:hypothetical protein
VEVRYLILFLTRETLSGEMCVFRQINVSSKTSTYTPFEMLKFI